MKNQCKKADAVLFFGALLGGKYPAWIYEVKDLGFKLLNIEEPVERTQRLNKLCELNPQHPNNLIDDQEIVAADDFSNLIDIVKSWQQKFNIKGVICNREQHVMLAAVACQILNLKGPGMFASLVSRDKIKQRRLLDAYSPSYKIMTKAMIINERDTLTYPLVFKPNNESGSHGVRRVNNPKEACEYSFTIQEGNSVLVEEFIIGREFSLESISIEGSLVFFDIVEKRTNEKVSNYFVEIGHQLPASKITSDERNSIFKTHCEILSHLSFETGVAHAEYRINSQGKIVLMEIAVRPPGDAIMELYSRVYGFSFVREIIKLMTDLSAVFPKDRICLYPFHEPS